MKRVMHADQQRIDLLCKDVWDYVFQMLDAEIDFSADDAGKAATDAENAVRAVMEARAAVDVD